MIDHPVPDSAAAAQLAGVLAPDERVVWCGRPDARRTGRVDPRLIGLGVFWTAVSGAAFWGFWRTALSSDFDGLPAPVRAAAVALCALPFAAVAFYALGGHVLLRRRAREHTAFAVTDRRILAARPRLVWFGRPHLRELPRNPPPRIALDEDRHDVGTLRFESPTSADPPVEFRDVRDAAAVAELVR